MLATLCWYPKALFPASKLLHNGTFLKANWYEHWTVRQPCIRIEYKRVNTHTRLYSLAVAFKVVLKDFLVPCQIWSSPSSLILTLAKFTSREYISSSPQKSWKRPFLGSWHIICSHVAFLPPASGSWNITFDIRRWLKRLIWGSVSSGTFDIFGTFGKNWEKISFY